MSTPSASRPEYTTALRRLHDYRVAAKLTTHRLADIVSAQRGIDNTFPNMDAGRITKLERAPFHEPTYAEALTLSRALLLPGITPLLTPASLDAMSHIFGPLRDDDLAWFRVSRDVPLSIACRIACYLGLPDPADLEHGPIHDQVWAVISRNERGAAPGQCPWCLAVVDPARADPDSAASREPEPHLPNCIPDALWGAWRRDSTTLIHNIPRPDRPRERGSARLARRLKVLRVGKGILQQQLAQDLGIHPNYLSQIERCERPMTLKNAEKAARLLGVMVDRIYD